MYTNNDVVKASYVSVQRAAPQDGQSSSPQGGESSYGNSVDGGNNIATVANGDFVSCSSEEVVLSRAFLVAERSTNFYA